MKIKLIAAIATASALISGAAQANDIRQVEAETEALAHKFMQGICNNSLEDVNAVRSLELGSLNSRKVRAVETCKKTGGVNRIDVKINPSHFLSYEAAGSVMTSLSIHYKDGSTQRALAYVDNGKISHMRGELLFSTFNFRD